MRFDYPSSELPERRHQEIPTTAVTLSQPLVRGRITLQGLGDGVMLARVLSTASIRIVATDRLPTKPTGNDLLIFCMHIAGRGHVRHYGRDDELTAGTAVLYEARSPWELTTAMDSQDLLLQFSRGLLPLQASEVTKSCARALDLRSPTLRALTGYLEWLDGHAGDLSDQRRVDAGHAAINMLVTVLRDAPPAPDEPARVRLEMLRAYVQDHLADPGLTVAELARRHRISARHVYNLFAGTATSPSAFIRSERLRAAQNILANPRNAELSISKIAASTGFADVRTFERAFRREFGITPGAWRHEI